MLHFLILSNNISALFFRIVWCLRCFCEVPKLNDRSKVRHQKYQTSSSIQFLDSNLILYFLWIECWILHVIFSDVQWPKLIYNKSHNATLFILILISSFDQLQQRLSSHYNNDHWGLSYLFQFVSQANRSDTYSR